MKVHVALYAGLSRYLPPEAQDRKGTIDAPDGATVLDVKRQLGMPDDLPGILLLNGKQAALDTVMRKGDTLAIFPPLVGGGPTRVVTASDAAPWERRT
jgi:molybdopterin converting factor small subunit